ncbi:MAG: (deoxy)nucleoside triphosphate pyrophosphohydrolase [Vagococcus sp.]
MKKNIPVVGAILIHENKILCAKRGYSKSLGGLWEFPGGKIEQNETPHQALIREIKEELLIDVTVDEDPFDVTQYKYDFGIVTLTTFICHLVSGTPVLMEHEACLWLPADTLSTLEWAPADMPAVKKLQTLTW